MLAGLAAGLEQRGYTVSRAASGEEALGAAAALEPDLVLMDICLPGMSGVEAAQKIRAALDVPVIFLSALDTDELVREAIGLGTLSYLVKPVMVKQLVPAIETALARGQELKALKASGEHLATALRQSREISVAIGVLMERHDISAEEAFETLRSHARSMRCKTSEVAQAVISGALWLRPRRAPRAP